MRTFKPYKKGNDRLRTLHDLDILDKHRALIPEPAYKLGQVKLWDVERPLPPDRLGRSGAQIRWTTPEIKSVEYAFPSDLGLGNGSLIQSLKELVGVCEGILEAFARLKAGDNSGADAGDNIRP